MSTILLLLAFLSIVGFIIGLINPAFLSPLFKKRLSRGKIAAIFILTFLAAAIVNGFVSPQKAQHAQPAAQIVTQQSTTIVQTPTSSKAPTPTQKPTATPTPKPTATPTIQYIPPTATPTPIVQQQTSTSTNAEQGNSPTGSINGSVPAGATALCNDGSYSYAEHHQGACSQHGGVKQFYN